MMPGMKLAPAGQSIYMMALSCCVAPNYKGVIVLNECNAYAIIYIYYALLHRCEVRTSSSVMLMVLLMKLHNAMHISL